MARSMNGLLIVERSGQADGNGSAEFLIFVFFYQVKEHSYKMTRRFSTQEKSREDLIQFYIICQTISYTRQRPRHEVQTVPFASI